MYAKECTCGAITVEYEGGSWSMEKILFERLFQGVELEEGLYSNCNHARILKESGKNLIAINLSWEEK